MTMHNMATLELALRQVLEEEFADIPPEDKIQLPVSEGFVKNCQRMIRQSRRGGVRRVRPALRRAVLVAAVVAALATTALASPQIREAVIRFFVRNEVTHYEFYFDPQQAQTAPKSIETVYRASYIPEGYTLISSDIRLSGVSYYWLNESRDGYIMFDQTVIGGITWAPNGENIDAQEMNLDGYQVFCVRDEGTIYYWTDNAYFYSLYCGPEIPQEQMRQIFAGITPDPQMLPEG